MRLCYHWPDYSLANSEGIVLSVFFNRLSSSQSLLILIGVSLLIKSVMAVLIPITGDEAYFIVWGNHLDYGYYDHPPMVGWWLAALLQVSDHPLWLRLPTIIGTTLIGWVMYRLVMPYGKPQALIVAGLYWLAPVHLMAPLITTDTPLIIFSFFSGVCFYKAQRQDHFGWYLLSGLLLGLAFYSKFFAGLLGVAYLFYVILFVRRGVRPYLGILWVLLGTLPFIGLNLTWNYYHCWNNYLFNLVNRTSDSNFSVMTFGTYLLLLLYVVTPPIVFFLIRQSKRLREYFRQGRLSVFMALFGLPILLFMGLSFGKSIGLHWLLSFYPFLFIGMMALLSMRQLQVSFHFMWSFSLLHLVAFGIVFAMLPGLIKSNEESYQDLVYAMYTESLLTLVKQNSYDFQLVTPSYSQSAILAYHMKQPVPVLGVGSYHGRQDDIITDYRAFDGKGLAIVSHKADVALYAKYFQHFTHVVLPFKGTQYHLGIGVHFNYAKYEQEVLQNVKQYYYQIPDWLPSQGCYYQ